MASSPPAGASDLELMVTFLLLVLLQSPSVTPEFSVRFVKGLQGRTAVSFRRSSGSAGVEEFVLVVFVAPERVASVGSGRSGVSGDEGAAVLPLGVVASCPGH